MALSVAAAPKRTWTYGHVVAEPITLVDADGAVLARLVPVDLDGSRFGERTIYRRGTPTTKTGDFGHHAEIRVGRGDVVLRPDSAGSLAAYKLLEHVRDEMRER